MCSLNTINGWLVIYLKQTNKRPSRHVSLCGCFEGLGAPSTTHSVQALLPAPRFGLSNRNSWSTRLHQPATKDDSEWKFSFWVWDRSAVRLMESASAGIYQWKKYIQTFKYWLFAFRKDWKLRTTLEKARTRALSLPQVCVEEGSRCSVEGVASLQSAPEASTGYWDGEKRLKTRKLGTQTPVSMTTRTTKRYCNRFFPVWAVSEDRWRLDKKAKGSNVAVRVTLPSL